MSALAVRVAARHRLAALIPDSFFSGFENELKQIYREKLGDRALEDAPYLMGDKVIPLLRRFIKELIDLAPSARKTLEERLEMRVTIVEKLREGYVNARKAIATPYPVTSVRDHIAQHIEFGVNDSLKKLLPTLGKAMKTGVSIDPDGVKKIVDKALKKVTPEIEKAIVEDNYASHVLEIKYGFYREHVDKSIPRLTKKSEVQTDFLAWFTFIRDMLAANYEKPARYTEFDLNGMHVMILDDAVTEKEHDKYVKYLDAAYHKLKRKKLSRAWYGRVIIECKDCGGPNPYTGGLTGGHFNIQKNWVKIFSRPSEFIVELMVHELGHRYWFKSMSPRQRHKFETLVKVYEPLDMGGEDKGEKVIIPAPNPIDLKRVARAKEAIGERLKELYQTLDTFEADHQFKFFRDAVEDWEGTITRIHRRMDDMPERAQMLVTAFDDETKALWKKVMIDARGAAFEFLDGRNFREVLERKIDALPDGTDTKAAFIKARKKYVEDAKALLRQLESATLEYLDRAVEKHNAIEAEKAAEIKAQKEKAFEADPREVLPVSGYGKNNIDEAFAEVFAWYCLDKELTADQEASFRAVILNQDRTAKRVAQRWGNALHDQFRRSQDPA